VSFLRELVFGYTNPDRSRAGIGALILATWHDGEWVYIGRVGTGVTDALLRQISNIADT
jgi:bifunctional non-homologous end joining protein LigD